MAGFPAALVLGLSRLLVLGRITLVVLATLTLLTLCDEQVRWMASPGLATVVSAYVFMQIIKIAAIPAIQKHNKIQISIEKLNRIENLIVKAFSICANPHYRINLSIWSNRLKEWPVTPQFLRLKPNKVSLLQTNTPLKGSADWQLDNRATHTDQMRTKQLEVSRFVVSALVMNEVLVVSQHRRYLLREPDDVIIPPVNSKVSRLLRMQFSQWEQAC